MSNFSLKALSKEGNSLTEFTLLDGPYPLSQQYFGLMNRPGTPYLRYDSVVRATGVADLYDGDIVESQGKRYIILYQKGYYAYTIDKKEKIPINDLINPIVVDHAFFSEEFSFPHNRSKKTLFKYDDIIFKLEDIYGVSNDKIILHHKRGILLNPDKIQQKANITYNGTPLFFGDEVNKRTLVLRNGQPLFRVRGRYKTVREMEGVK